MSVSRVRCDATRAREGRAVRERNSTSLPFVRSARSRGGRSRPAVCYTRVTLKRSVIRNPGTGVH